MRKAICLYCRGNYRQKGCELVCHKCERKAPIVHSCPALFTQGPAEIEARRATKEWEKLQKEA